MHSSNDSLRPTVSSPLPPPPLLHHHHRGPIAHTFVISTTCHPVLPPQTGKGPPSSPTMAAAFFEAGCEPLGSPASHVRASRLGSQSRRRKWAWVRPSDRSRLQEAISLSYAPSFVHIRADFHQPCSGALVEPSFTGTRRDDVMTAAGVPHLPSGPANANLQTEGDTINRYCCLTCPTLDATANNTAPRIYDCLEQNAG